MNFTQNLLDFDDMAFHEVFRNSAQNLMEPCYAFYLPKHAENFSTYKQIVWPHEKEGAVTVADMHFYVGSSVASQARKVLVDHYASDVQEIGMTRAYGHTLGITHLSESDRPALASLTNTVKTNGRIIPFMSNVFETTQGADCLLGEMEWQYDSGVVEMCMYENDGYAQLKHDYLHAVFPQASHAYRKKTTETMVNMFVNAFKKPTEENIITDKFMAYLERDGDDPKVYAAHIKHVQTKPTLFKGVAYQ